MPDVLSLQETRGEPCASTCTRLPSPSCRAATIPAGVYSNEEEVRTFSVGATFISSSDVPDEIVHTVVKAVFNNFDQFRKLHPAFANLIVIPIRVVSSLMAPVIVAPGAQSGLEMFYFPRSCSGPWSGAPAPAKG